MSDEHADNHGKVADRKPHDDPDPQSPPNDHIEGYVEDPLGVDDGTPSALSDPPKDTSRTWGVTRQKQKRASGTYRRLARPQGGRRNWVLLALIVLVVTLLLSNFSDRGIETIPYSELKAHIQDGLVAEVVVSSSHVDAVPTPEAAPEGVSRWRAVRVPDDESFVPLVEAQGLELSAREEGTCSSGVLLFWLGPLVIIVFFWSIVYRRMGGGGPGTQAMTFGRAKFKLLAEEGTGVSFVDVAGVDEAKAELELVVEFLREPQKFHALGGHIPKGVLLVGPPGTGKTLLARAVAGEAKVPFFNISGSDFVEMFVGVGAARVRDLFEQAQALAPCIIFIDELDAVGKARGAAGAMSTNDEREQTLNALLVEMDGFSANLGVIILAATNRPEILDAALLRAGRFDRQVLVDRPDIRGREAILKVHTAKLVMDSTLDLRKIAAQTPGFVGADLANIANEAALLAVRRGADQVEQRDFQDAIENVIAGLQKKNRRLNPREQRIVAYHESGHAVAAAALKHADPVHKVSIIPRGIGALGYTLQVPLEDRYLMTKNELRHKIGALLGGRAAEIVVFEDVSTGAQNDLLKATDIARRMVTEYGMSADIGPVHLGDASQQPGFMGVFGQRRDFSEQTARQIDAEVKEILRVLLEHVVDILKANRDLLEEMATFLLVEEVLEGDALNELLGRVRSIDAIE